MKKVVVIGGGTGTFVILTGIKKYALHIGAVVSMMDSGGSTGRLRDQLGVLPPGDLRQCLVALSEAPDLWRKLFLYRFKNGDLKGHNFGNILLTALEKTTKRYQDVVDTASYILNTRGRVLPVTMDKVNLCVEYEDGEVLEGEDMIDTASHKQGKIRRAYLKPNAKANVHARKAIDSADYVILGPGDLYTSLIPNLLVDSISEALKTSASQIIVVINLMTKIGQTTNYKASDHIRDLESYIGRRVDHILINDQTIPSVALSYYKNHGEKPVDDNLGSDRRVTRSDFITSHLFKSPDEDSVKRSLLRHDPAKLGSAIYSIITGSKTNKKSRS